MIRKTELKHYGVLGNDTYNKKYTSSQRKYDRAMYGIKAEKRIIQKMNDGHNIQSARHYEVKHRDRNNAIKKGAKKVASVMGSIGTAYLADQIFYNGAGTAAAKAAVNKIIKK